MSFVCFVVDRLMIPYWRFGAKLNELNEYVLSKHLRPLRSLRLPSRRFRCQNDCRGADPRHRKRPRGTTRLAATLRHPRRGQSVAHRRLAQWQTADGAGGIRSQLVRRQLENPRTIYTLPNGDVLVMESRRRQGPSRIILLRDDNKDGKPDRREVFLDNLNGAFGMALARQPLLRRQH